MSTLFLIKPVARSGKVGVRKKKKWTQSGCGSPKGGGSGRGKCPLPRFARKLLKTLIWQHKRINSLQTHVHVPKHSQPKNKQDEQFNFMRAGCYEKRGRG